MTSFRIFVHTESPSSTPSSLSKISPILLLIIVLLAVIFFLVGTVHLLVRLLAKRPSSSQENSLSDSHALQRQLRQLFRLHDSGVEQSVIDVLPVFRYEDVVGAKLQPFDCAICLCEFAGRDTLRLLPGCGHAFHAHCIDTWLLANSTCPLCRRTLLLADLFDAPTEEKESDGDGDQIIAIRESNPSSRVFTVRLGKLGISNGAGSGETSRCNVDARRCYSMGSCQYVVVESDLQVTLCCESVGAPEPNTGDDHGGADQGRRIGRRQKGDSFSVSKIWLWSKNGRFPSCSDADVHIPTPVTAGFQTGDRIGCSQMV